jgi:Polysaccharide deacetylase
MEFNAVQLKGLVAECKGFVSAYGGMYPDFVFGKDLNDGVTPVFFYHRIDGELFRDHLQHLKSNGYRTLNADELYESLSSRGLRDSRQVVLTFDDGLDDLYSVVYPLLQKFRVTAIAYIVPGWVGKSGFVTWSQIEEMHDSGLVDFQSHSMTHSSIFTSPRIVDFFHPRYFRAAQWEIPLLAQGSNGITGAEPSYGTPIYTWTSRLSDSLGYFPDPRLKELCVSYAAKNGGDGFFKRPGWRHRLRKLTAAFEQENRSTHSYEDDGERRNSIEREIEMSKHAIESRLFGKIVRHFAFPWHQSGDLAKKALVNAGYRTVAGGLSADHRHMTFGHNAFELARVNGDFLPTLPGIGRQHFWTIMSSKMARRLYSGTPY